MPDLVTLQEAKDHLRVDHDFEDADILAKLEAAEAIARKHITEPVVRSDGSAEPQVKAAVLLLLGILYAERDVATFEGIPYGYLPFTVTALLSQFRKPTVV